jgi:hypothetical protein
MNVENGMSGQGHPSTETLFWAIEGELSTEEMLQVGEHLKTCWECRSESELVENGIFAFMDYRKRVVLPRVDEPPNDWSQFDLLLKNTVEQCEQMSPREVVQQRSRELFSALRSFLTVLVSLRMRAAWLSAVALVGLGVFLVTSRLSHPPAVSAMEFLLRASESRHASTQDVKNPLIHQRVRIRRGSHAVTRDLYQPPRVGNAPTAVVAASPEMEQSPELEQLFSSYHLDWADPLSASAFAQWHEALSSKKDEVNTEGAADDPARRITLTTHAPASSPIRDASLSVIASSWRRVEERLRFKDDSELEITELAFDVTSELPREVPKLPAPTVTAVRPPKAPAPPEPVRFSEAQLESSEVQVRAALHQLGADLGEQIEIRQTPNGHVSVEGLVPTEERQEDIVFALMEIPALELSVRVVEDPVGPKLDPDVIEGVGESKPPKPVFYDLLAQRFPKADPRQRFVNAALADSQEMLVRVWALRRLAERYNSTQAKALDDTSCATLYGVLRDHLNKLSESVAASRSAYALLTSAVPFADVSAESKAADWQTEVVRIFAAVEKIDHYWTTALVAANSPTETSSQLSESLGRLYSEVEGYLKQFDGELPR